MNAIIKFILALVIPLRLKPYKLTVNEGDALVFIVPEKLSSTRFEIFSERLKEGIEGIWGKGKVKIILLDGGVNVTVIRKTWDNPNTPPPPHPNTRPSDKF